MTDDPTLLRRYLEKRDQDAFTEIVRHHLPFVYSAALRRTNGDSHLANDVAQVVFSSLAHESERLLRHASIIGWLYVATRNAAFNALRAERRRRQRELVVMSSELPADSAIDWEQLRPVLDAAIDRLSSIDRDAVLLRFFEARTYGEIGRILDVTEDAARVRVDRALTKLRSRLSRAGITSTAAALGLALTSHAVAAEPAGMVQTIAMQAMVPDIAPLASLTSILHMMNTSKMIWTAAATIVVLSIASAVFEGNQARNGDAALTAIRAERDELKIDIQRLESQNASAQNPARLTGPSITAEPPPKLTAQVGGPRPTDPAISPNALRPSNPLASLYSLRSNPDAMEAWLKAERSSLVLQFEPLFQRLRLTDAQQDAFKHVAMEKFEAVADISSTARAQNLAATDPAIRAAFKEATDQAENAWRSLLGPDGYQQLQQFGATMEIRETVRSLAGDLYPTAPLDANTAERLVETIAQNTKQSSSGYKVDTTDWPAVLASSAGFLSPTQLSMLRAEADQAVLRKQLADLSKAAPKPAH
jgi:RNA polymerase sigma factor (sigma-70 family)